MTEKLWRFGEVRFDAAAGKVRVGAEWTELDRSSHAILLALAEARGTAVGKDALLDAGWPGRQVQENSLAKAIARLRGAFGPEAPRVEAVYGQGYRLVVDEAELQPSVLPPAPVRKLSASRRHFGIAAVLVALAVLVIVGWSWMSQRGGVSPLKIGEASDSIGRVLWIDDHPENNVKEKRHLEARRIAVYNVRSSEDALKLLAMYKYDAVISDMGRNGNPLAGLELVRDMRARKDFTPFVLYTILPSKAQRDLLAQYGGQGVAVTPEGLYSFILPEFERRAAAEVAD